MTQPTLSSGRRSTGPDSPYRTATQPQAQVSITNPTHQQPAYEYEQDFRNQNGAASRSMPHLGVNIDVEIGGLASYF